jgi:hypothetical protein
MVPAVPMAFRGSLAKSGTVLWRGRSLWFRVAFGWWALPIAIALFWAFILTWKTNRGLLILPYQKMARYIWERKLADKSQDGAGEFLGNIERAVGLPAKNGEGCVVCNENQTTEEHIIPKWLQRKHGLWQQQLNRPNGTSMDYGKLKVSLCEVCNSNHFSKLENLISALDWSKTASAPETSLALQLWVTKIYYFLQLFEQSKTVHDPVHGNRSLVSSEDIFNAHLLQIILKQVGSPTLLEQPLKDPASLWIFECSEDWDPSEFMYASSSGQNIICLKISSKVLFAIVGDWGQYKMAGALGWIDSSVDSLMFYEIFILLQYLVEKNGISTSFGFTSQADGQDPKLIPIPIPANDLNICVYDDYGPFRQAKFEELN